MKLGTLTFAVSLAFATLCKPTPEENTSPQTPALFHPPIPVSSFYPPLASEPSFCDEETIPEDKNKGRLWKLHRFLKTEYGIQSRAYCTTASDDNILGLAVSPKNSLSLENPLTVHEIDNAEKIRRIAANYDQKLFDVYIYYVHTPGSPLTPKFFQRDPVDQVQIFIHERLHDELNFQGSNYRMLEEPLADLLGYTIAKEYFQRHEPELTQLVEEKLEERLQRAEVITRVMGNLEEIYRSPSLNPQQKKELQEKYYQELREKLGDQQVNNATLAREWCYVKNLPLLYNLFIATDSDTRGTLDFYRSLAGDWEEAMQVVEEFYHEMQGDKK